MSIGLLRRSVECSWLTRTGETNLNKLTRLLDGADSVLLGVIYICTSYGIKPPKPQLKYCSLQSRYGNDTKCTKEVVEFPNIGLYAHSTYHIYKSAPTSLMANSEILPLQCITEHFRQYVHQLEKSLVGRRVDANRRVLTRSKLRVALECLAGLVCEEKQVSITLQRYKIKSEAWSTYHASRTSHTPRPHTCPPVPSRHPLSSSSAYP